MTTSKFLIRASSMIACMTLAACGNSLTNGAVGLSSLARMAPELAGMNCPSGGQAIQVGVDDNSNMLLDDNEVDGVSYICNAAANDVGVEFHPIPTGDARCAAGGTEIRVGRSDGQGGLLAGFQSHVTCNGTLGVVGTKGETGDVGAKGAKGDAGDMGAQGAKGAKGDTGDQGSQGTVGAQGTQGAQGAKGAKGDTGNQGSQGTVGAQGAQGNKGDKGDTGDTGTQGGQGQKGDKGDMGDTGAQGVKGGKGDTGDAGGQGVKGGKGDTGDAGGQGAKGAQGNKGDKGDTGNTGTQGPVGPDWSNPAFGRFFTNQVVDGLIVTCTSVTLSALETGCTDPKVNGLDVRAGMVDMTALCTGVTGKAELSMSSSVSPIDVPYVLRNGSEWELSEDATGVSRLTAITCNR